MAYPLPWGGLCHNERNGMFVILNPSPYVILSEAPVPVSFSRTRPGEGLAFWLRENSVKNLMESIS